MILMVEVESAPLLFSLSFETLSFTNHQVIDCLTVSFQHFDAHAAAVVSAVAVAGSVVAVTLVTVVFVALLPLTVSVLLVSDVEHVLAVVDPVPLVAALVFVVLAPVASGVDDDDASIADVARMLYSAGVDVVND